MRYHGTDIDGVFIEPDALEVRGVNLNDIIRTHTYPEALAHLFFGVSRPESSAAIERALGRALDALGDGAAELELVLAARQTGATISQSVTAGLMAKSAHIEADESDTEAGLDDDLVEGLHYVGVLPAYVAVASSSSAEEARERLSRMRSGDEGYVTRILRLFVPAPSAEQLQAFEWLLVAWHAGFGYLPPSVMMPRIAIGTGVAIRQALGAGFAAAGPMHIGACEHAMHLYRAVLAKSANGALAAAMDGAIAGLLAQKQRIPGFGHPLFREDPRPICLRALARERGMSSRGLDAFDAAAEAVRHRAELNPNIDAISAGLFLTAGVEDPATGSNLAMAARAAGMLAHILERKRRPAFGVTSDVARQHLDTLPKDWL